MNFTIRVLVTGASGQLGRDVVRRLGELGIEVIGIDKDDLNLTDDRKVEQFVKAIGPHVVVHCAAYTAVDAAKTIEKRVMRSMQRRHTTWQGLRRHGCQDGIC